jgi:KUP system potassium uptake protein
MVLLKVNFIMNQTTNKHGSLGVLTLGALGVVFGDIGTSPIYALKESLHTAGTELFDIYGVVSLIFWSLMLVVTLKYLVFVLRADNNGEGGILSLFALLPGKVRNATGGTRYLFVIFLLLGTALLVADGMLTPAISVLSATEGLETLNADLASWTVPLTVLILFILFAFQYKGSNTLGRVFGPVILIWFLTLGVLGFVKVQEHPEVIKALSPIYAIEYVAHHGFHTFIILSSVILAITGAEALYADLGHFGKRPIRLGWIFIVAPALVLNYLGQAVIAIQDPGTDKSLFFALAPNDAVRIFLVVLATLATVIASQALITGVASLSRQAVRLGLLPRLKVVHTSSTVIGQIYVPAVNLIVGLGSIFLVVNFKTSSALANAYSFAISATMLMTTLAFGYVAADKFKWNKKVLALTIPLLVLIDLSFFLATVTKLLKGAWVPLLIGFVIAYVMWTWRKGQSALESALQKQDMRWEEVERQISSGSVSIIPDTGIYLSSSALKVPQALVAQLNNLHSCPKEILIVSVVQGEVPFVSAKPILKEVNPRVNQLYVWVGYMQDVNIQKSIIDHVMSEAEEQECTYYLADRKFLESSEGSLKGLTEKVFGILHRNSATASSYFGLPENRVITLGTQIDL